MNEARLSAIILAAGKGTRMKSSLPKVLHPVAGQPMILRAIQACRDAGVEDIRVVVGHGKELVQQVIEPTGARAFVQTHQLGTADAVKAADVASLEGTVLILNGDHPLLGAEDLKDFLGEFKEQGAAVAVVTVELDDPGSFGRIVRSGGSLRAIVEAKDASPETLKIHEVNTGLYLVKASALQEYLPQIDNNNKQQEFYLTDLIEIALESQQRVIGIKGNSRVAFGVNSQMELAQANKEVFRKKARALMEEGVIILDPENTYIEDGVKVGASTMIYPNVFLKGRTTVGSFCVIEPGCFILDSELAEHVEVKANSYLESAKVGSGCAVGPFARLRPETVLEQDCKIGNFVELKKAKLGKGVKASHLSYLGDAEIGEDTNVGCGTITCNYAADRKKYKTVIGKNVFVGSDSQFVAPITVGDNAVIGSGSTITKDVPSGALAVARGKQFTKENYTPKAPAKKD